MRRASSAHKRPNRKAGKKAKKNKRLLSLCMTQQAPFDGRFFFGSRTLLCLIAHLSNETTMIAAVGGSHLVLFPISVSLVVRSWDVQAHPCTSRAAARRLAATCSCTDASSFFSLIAHGLINKGDMGKTKNYYKCVTFSNPNRLKPLAVNRYCPCSSSRLTQRF
jgi:hypothetical protein